MKKKIFLKELQIKDVTKEYVSWMNNKEIMKYTEIDKKQNLKSVKAYVKDKSKSKYEYLFGIYVNEKNNLKKHIGNIKLGPINFSINFLRFLIL